MWRAIIKYAKVIIASVVLALIFTTSTHAWSTDSVPEFESSSVKSYSSYPCSGKYGTIAVSGEGVINACVMGENTKVASYLRAEGGVSYAVSFPLDTAFYRLDVCEGIWGCSYAEQNDTFAGVTGVYKNLVRNLSKNVQRGVVHYAPRENLPIFSVAKFGNKTFYPQSTALSQNGKWALVELREYGFIRINVQTLVVRRVIAPGISYGYGSDPSIELGISNDGNAVAVIGLRMGVQIVTVNETCGDIPNEFMQTYYTGAVTACRNVPTQPNKYIPDFKHALRPVFSKDNKTFSFDAYSYTTPARHITMFSSSSDKQGDAYYLALGDSFTSGEGEVSDSYYLGGAANKCHVSSRSYPFLLADAWNIPGTNTACSGATMQSARGMSPKQNQTIQLTELESRSPKVATIGIGGNDAGLIGKLKDCLGLDTCKWASTAEDRHSTAMEIKNLYPRLKEFYSDVKVRTLGPVIVVGYPRIISAQQMCPAVIGGLLNQSERTFMNEAIRYLNQTIRAAATDVGVEYADVEEAFAGGELCSSFESPLMNGVRTGDDYPSIAELPFVKIIGAESFHPKPDGHVKVAAKILQKFSNVNTITESMNSGTPTVAPTPSSYWDANESNLTVQRAISFLNKVTVKKKDVFEISFPVLSFLPSSDIVLELHSEVKSLGTVKSAEDGSLNVTISSNGFDPGFHSVHAIGKNFAGNDFDTYDFLNVEDDPPMVAPVVPIALVGNTPGDGSSNSTQSYSSHSPIAINKASPLDVLGASVAANPNLNTVDSAKEAATPLLQHSKVRQDIRFNWVAVVALASGIVILCVWLYAYNRQKQPSNPE